MSTYIRLNRNPESPEDRRKLIGDRIGSSDRLELSILGEIRESVLEFLVFRKGYCRSDLQINMPFPVSFPGASFIVEADVVVMVKGNPFLLIRCAASSMESWERQAVALCRVGGSRIIPFAVVTDGSDANILDAVKGKPLSEGLESLPSQEEAIRFMKEFEPLSIPEERAEREKRILHAFAGIRCPADDAAGEPPSATD